MATRLQKRHQRARLSQRGPFPATASLFGSLRACKPSLIPVGVQWIRNAAQTFEPEENRVRLKNSDTLTYDYLVVCTGVKLDWGKIAGLAETLGKTSSGVIRGIPV